MSFLTDLLTNPVLTGILGGSVAASLLYTLRSLPNALVDLVLWQFTSVVLISNDSNAFDTVAEWLGVQESSKRSRKLRLTTDYSEHEQQNTFILSPGLGYSMVWYKGYPVVVHRTMPGGDADRFGRVKEFINLRTLGTSPILLRDLLGTIAESKSGNCNHVEIYLYQNYWRKVARKEKRPLKTVVIPTEQRSRIIRDIEKFRDSKERYRSLGIPYRRGYLFTGPPGTGKTSLVLALAGYFGLRVYAVNLGSIKGDNDLIEAITSVPENAILLIEDIDVAQKKRDEEVLKPVVEKTTAAPGDPPGKQEVQTITLSGLLNAIDGVFSRDGRILVMTTNYPEKLDSALKRPGRADLEEVLSELGTTEIRTMCEQFLGEAGEAFASTVPVPIPPAELQKKLLEEYNRAPAEDPDSDGESEQVSV